ncbi:MAG: endonuclease/exonuclease/phosphatase family protein [Actinomycetota bacterium]|nr:endonuclease/exonuclease/phosphatase family protein [Actinomycetota bacterium]
MRLRMVSWNIDSRPTGLLDAKVELLRQIQPDLAVLQEINRSVYRALLPHPLAHERIRRQSRIFSWGTLSTDLCYPRGSEHRLGCAILGAPTTALLGAQVLDRVPFEVPEPVRLGFLWRTVAARVALSTGMALTAGSFHARRSAGSQAIALQRAFHAGIARWLAGVSGPVVFGMSAGVPAVDPPDVRGTTSWSVLPEGTTGADPLLGPDASHELDDVLRRYLHHHPEELEQIRAARPGGPLAVSHYVSTQPVRHDHLWATRDLKVLDVRYLYDEAVAAGSDHAVVLADFET